MQRYVKHEFSGNLPSTVGAQFEKIPMNINNVDITLNVWDLGGNKMFKGIASAYYRGIKAAVIFFDVSNLDDIKQINNTYDEIKKYAPKDTLIYLAANKCDLKYDRINILKYTENIPAINTFFISAKENAGIDDMFNTIASNLTNPASISKAKNKDVSNKILFLGESSSGKSSFIDRLIDDSYSNKRHSSTEITKHIYKIKGENITYFMTIIDFPGNLSLSTLDKNHEDDLNNVDSVIIFIDSSQHQTMLQTINNIKKYLKYVHKNIHKDIPIYLNLSKSDLKLFDSKSIDKITKFIFQHRIQRMFFTSSKTNFNIKETIYYIIGYLQYIHKIETGNRENKIENQSKYDFTTLNKLSAIYISTNEILSIINDETQHLSKITPFESNFLLRSFYKIDYLSKSILLN